MAKTRRPRCRLVAIGAVVLILRCGVASGGVALDAVQPACGLLAHSDRGPGSAIPGLRGTEGFGRGGLRIRPRLVVGALDAACCSACKDPALVSGLHLRGGGGTEDPKGPKDGALGGNPMKVVGKALEDFFGFFSGGVSKLGDLGSGLLKPQAPEVESPPDPSVLLKELETSSDDISPQIVRRGASKGILGKKGTPGGAAGAKALMAMARLGKVKAVTALLQIGVDINAGDHNETRTAPLHFAAAEGQLEVVNTLCQLGANVECRDGQGWTALHQASSTPHVIITQARWLLRNVGAVRFALAPPSSCPAAAAAAPCAGWRLLRNVGPVRGLCQLGGADGAGIVRFWCRVLAAPDKRWRGAGCGVCASYQGAGAAGRVRFWRVGGS